jgi:hypothetical protein
MRIAIGGSTKTIDMRTPNNFASALKSPLLIQSVVSITSSQEHNALLKLLNSTARPYAVCVLVVK